MSAEILDLEMVSKRLRTALEELSKLNVEQVVELFIREDARGPRHHHCKCPTAVFLERRTGEGVSVGLGDVVLVRDVNKIFPLPTSVKQFIWAYDRGQFPELWRREQS